MGSASVVGEGRHGSGTPDTALDRRRARQATTRAEIVAAAWELVRERGVAGLALRELGDRVGMKAQSLYSYFDSKHDIYDAMFREGYQAFATAVETVIDREGSARELLRLAGQVFFEFCTSDPARHQLLFQRTIPDFVPSEASYAVALEVYATMTARFVEAGIDDPAAADLWTAVMTGLADQQISNDPGGDRWARLVDRAVDMFLRDVAPHLLEPTT